MRTLLEDGLDKAARGLTTLEEVSPWWPSTSPLDPVASVASPREHASRLTRRPRPRHQFGPAPLPPRRRRRVLIVEDSPTIVSVVKYFLELEGFEVLVAGDGRTGLDMALVEHPDVIVSDVNMPAMTGVEMVRALRGDPRAADVRILMLTSEASVESEAAGPRRRRRRLHPEAGRAAAPGRARQGAARTVATARAGLPFLTGTVQTMRHLKVWQKLALMGAVFMMPFASSPTR